MFKHTLFFLIVSAFFFLVGCNVSSTEQSDSDGHALVSSPESQALKVGTNASPGINQFVLINYPGGPLARYFNFEVSSRGRMWMDRKNGSLVFSGCDISAGSETVALQTLDNGKVTSSVIMVDPRGELVIPGVQYRLSYELSQLGSCPKIVGTLPAIFTPETLKEFGPFEMNDQLSSIQVGDSSPYEVVFKFTATSPTMLTPVVTRSDDFNCRYSVQESWSFAKSSDDSASSPGSYTGLDTLSDLQVRRGETVWLKLSGSGSEGCPNLNYSYRASTLTSAQSSFSQIFSIPATSLTGQLANAKSIGCANSKQVIYFDLGSTDLGARDARPINGFGASRMDLNKKTPLIQPVFLGFTPTSGPLSGLSFVNSDSDRGTESWRADLEAFSDSWILNVDAKGNFNSPVSSGSFFCELFNRSVIDTSTQVKYQCDGVAPFQLYFNRPFNEEPLVEYENEATFFGNASSCDSYYSYFPVTFAETRTAQGRSFSNLDWVTVAGVLKYVDRVYYTQSQKRESYVRHLESPNWNDVTGPNPPASFTITRTDAANWYTSSDSKCSQTPEHRSTHLCRKM